MPHTDLTPTSASTPGQAALLGDAGYLNGTQPVETPERPGETDYYSVVSVGVLVSYNRQDLGKR
jgi:hypothetical protein